MLRQYELVDRVLSYDPEADEALLNRAYVFSVNAHGSQKRASGDPYFSHPIEVAGILTDLHLDDETIATAILHDTIEDTVATPEEIRRLFGENVARMVDGVTKLSKIEAQTESERAAENLRKFLLAMSDDIRVLLVKLADRLHNMRTLHHIKNPDKRKRIARETMDIYAPLAERIGMYEFMKEMQTLAFKELEPEAYESITKRLDSLSVEGEDRIAKIASGLKLLLARGGVETEISGREKHPYSIWKKMSERHVSLEQLSDIMAFRAIVETEEECYRALGVIHRRWPMVPGRFKDYISTPKRNGYRSLHTTIMHAGDTRVEIQIRTRDMHARAEFGLAAHWAYKQDSVRPDTQVSWIRDLIEILEHAESPEELLEHTRMAMYQDRIFAFTPKGELIQLPKGATPIDFAYAVHTDLGDQAVGAKVNGKVVPLRTEIQQGDQVAILRSKAQEPQANWLNFAITGKARAAIRRHIRHKERDETVALGRKLYDEIVQRLPTPPGEGALTDALKRLKLADEETLMEAIARRKLTDTQVLEAVMPGSTDGAEHEMPSQARAIDIKGLTPGVAFDFAEDCRPVPGDRIVGVRRPGEPIEVHRIDCASLGDTDEEDWVDLTWGDKAEGGIARIAVTLKNEPGALGAVATLIGGQKANILGLRMDNRDTTFHTNTIDLEVRNAMHLMKLLAALRAADVVNAAERRLMLAAALLLLAASPAFAPASPDMAVQRAAPMDDQRFWNIVERSGLNARSQEQQEANLRRALAALPVADLVAWQAAYDAKRAAAYSWDLWGAAYVIHGGASDDGFDYFRNWLISRGRRVYEAALADPESLAATIPAGMREAAEFEGFGYVAVELWAKRIGRNPAEMPGGVAQPARPSGKPWKEDDAVLAARCPKLWKRFASAPLE